MSPPSKMKPMPVGSIVLFCGLLLTMTAFSVDIVLPAFSLISVGLPAEYSLVQLTIPVFIFFTGIGQILMGPISDRFGRKPIIMMGLGIYCLGAFICFVAPEINTLLIGRAIQGIGASVGPVLGRSVLRDLFQGANLASNMALATMIFAFGPIIAPLAGVLFMQMGSWRMIFFVIMIFGLVLLAIGIFKLPETIVSRNPAATGFKTIRKNIGLVLAHPQSRFYLLMSGPITTIIMLILISIPRVYKESFGIEGPLFAVFFAIHGTGIIIGQWANRKIISGYGTANAMRTGSVVVFVTALVLLIANAIGVVGPFVLSGFMIIFATGYLVILSNATALTLDSHGSIAGFVSSFLGFSAQLVSSVLAYLIAIWIGGDLSSFLIALVVITGLVMTALFFRMKLQQTRTTIKAE